MHTGAYTPCDARENSGIGPWKAFLAAARGFPSNVFTYSIEKPRKKDAADCNECSGGDQHHKSGDCPRHLGSTTAKSQQHERSKNDNCCKGNAAYYVPDSFDSFAE